MTLTTKSEGLALAFGLCITRERVGMRELTVYLYWRVRHVQAIGKSNLTSGM